MARPFSLQRLLQSDNPVPLIGATLVGFMTAMLFMLYSHHLQLREMEATIDANQIAASKMRILSEQMELSRTRGRLIAQIIDTSDPFEQDSLHQEFETYAGRFIALQQQLHSLPLAEREQHLLEEQRKLISLIVPLQRQVIALAKQGSAANNKQVKQLFYNEMLPRQGEMIEQYQQLISWEQQWIDQLAAQSHVTTAQEHLHQFILAAITLLSALLITLLVTHRVHRIQRAQQRSHNELDQAVRERTRDLQQARNMLQSVLDTIPVRVFWKGRDSRYLGGNRLFALDSGVESPQQLNGMPIEETRWAVDAQRHLQDDQQIFETGVQLLNREVPFVDEEGKQHWLELSKVPLTDAEGRIIGLLGCYQEITERHEAQQKLADALEQARSASLAKSEFLSSMSHELRTPLNAILGFAQLLESDPALSAEQQDNIEDILKAGVHLLELINDILDLSRIEAGHLDLSLERLSLAEMAQTCMKLIAPMAQKQQVSLHYDPSQFAHIMLHADYRRTRQVLFNLLSNAVKYNRRGGHIYISCTATAGRARIEVRDTGLGIAPAKLTRLFVAFERLGAETGPIEGTGIGLVITRQLLSHMGGSLGFASVEGEGSSFWFELPLHEGDALQDELQQTLSSPPVTPPATQQTKTLLYIEDNPVNLKLVSKMIASRSHLQLLTADKPLLGIELALSALPDLILLDINLPGMNGFEVLQQLRDQPATRAIPIIAVTANAMTEQVRRGHEAGFNDYLTKPLKLELFFATLEKHLTATTA